MKLGEEMENVFFFSVIVKQLHIFKVKVGWLNVLISITLSSK